MKVKIQKTNVKKTGTKLKNNANDLRTELKKTKAVFDKLSIYWTGSDFNKLKNDVNTNYFPILLKLCNKWESYGRYLEKVPNPYNEIENTYMRKNLK